MSSAKKKKITHKPRQQSRVQQEKKSSPAIHSVEINSGMFAFGRENYILLLVGLFFLLLGFVLMLGGGSDDPAVFSDKIFNFRRLTLAPILILIGYGIEVYAIMKKAKD